MKDPRERHVDEQEKTPIPARYEDLVPAHSLGEMEEATIRTIFTKFSLAFLKASSLTGYYPPDHPSILNIAEEPHLHLHRLYFLHHQHHLLHHFLDLVLY